MSTRRGSGAILLVEDDPGHSVLIERNLRRAGVTVEIVVLEDGKKAVDYLLKQGVYASRTGAQPLHNQARGVRSVLRCNPADQPLSFDREFLRGRVILPVISLLPGTDPLVEQKIALSATISSPRPVRISPISVLYFL